MEFMGIDIRRSRGSTIAEMLGMKEEEWDKHSEKIAGIMLSGKYDDHIPEIAEIFPKTDIETRAKIILYAKNYHARRVLSESRPY